MKNIGQYNQDLSVPRKKDIDSLETRVKTNEDNIAMAESDIEGLTTDVGTLKTDVSNVKIALGNYVSKIDTNGQAIASSFEAANSIKVQTSGEVNNTIRLLSSDVEPSIEATSGGSRMSISLVPQYNEVSFNADDNVTLTGIKAGTNDTDAVNVSQLNEVKKSIPSSSNFVKKTEDTMTGSLTVNGNITASTVSYPKLIVRPTASGAGEGFMESSGHSTSVVARNVVGNNSNSRTLSIKDSVNAATLDNAIQLVDRVSNTSKYYNIIHAGNIANYGGQIVSVISDTGGTFTYLGSVTTKLHYYKFTSQYNLPNPAILLNISIPYSSTIGVFKVMCSYIQNYTPATIWFMSMDYVTDFTHDSSTKIYYIAT